MINLFPVFQHVVFGNKNYKSLRHFFKFFIFVHVVIIQHCRIIYESELLPRLLSALQCCKVYFCHQSQKHQSEQICRKYFPRFFVFAPSKLSSQVSQELFAKCIPHLLCCRRNTLRKMYHLSSEIFQRLQIFFGKMFFSHRHHSKFFLHILSQIKLFF